MATKITPEIEEKINELYCQYGVKAKVARELKISPATVTKYIIPNYIPIAHRTIKKCDVEPTWDFSPFMGEVGEMGNICALSLEELSELLEFQKEVTI